MSAYQFIKCINVFLIFITPVGAFANDLTLAEAEQIALHSDFITQKLKTRAASLGERAIADGQLPDPRIKFGIINMPVVSFDRSQQPITQLQFGLQQSFPRGRTLHYKSLQTQAVASIDEALAFDREKQVLRSLRNIYLDLYLNINTESILQQNRDLFIQMLDITQRQYAAGRDNQHDVLNAQLELALMDDRIAEITGAKDIALAELAKWIGVLEAQRPLPTNFPELPPLLTLDQMLSDLQNHPLIQVENAHINVNNQRIKIAEEQYKPGWMLDVTYGERIGNSVDGSSRDDLVSAMLIVDLPLFTDRRQDKRLAASKLQNTAAHYARSDRLLELRRQVEKEYAHWVRLKQRFELYKTRAIIDAAQNSESTLKAYQNDLTDFTTLMRARLTELNIQINMLQIRINHAKSQANLLYFARTAS